MHSRPCEARVSNAYETRQARPPKLDGRTAAIGETALTAVLWGTSFPIIAVGLSTGVDPVTFVFLRFALAAPLFLALAKVTKRGMAALLRDRAVWLIAAFNAVGFLCQFVGQSYTDPSSAALLVNLATIFTAVASAAILKERFGTLKTLGVVLAMVGTVLVTTRGNLALVTGGEALGDAFFLLAAFTWTGYMIYDKKLTDERRWDPVAVSAAIVTLTAVLLVPSLPLARGYVVNPTALGIAVYMAAFNTVIPWALYQHALQSLTATASAVVLMLEIVTALVISVALLGQAMDAVSATGAASILVSIYFVSRS